MRGCFSIDGLADTLTKSISIPVTNHIKVLLGFNMRLATYTTKHMQFDLINRMQ